MNGHIDTDTAGDNDDVTSGTDSVFWPIRDITVKCLSLNDVICYYHQKHHHSCAIMSCRVSDEHINLGWPGADTPHRHSTRWNGAIRVDLISTFSIRTHMTLWLCILCGFIDYFLDEGTLDSESNTNSSSSFDHALTFLHSTSLQAISVPPFMISLSRPLTKCVLAVRACPRPAFSISIVRS